MSKKFPNHSLDLVKMNFKNKTVVVTGGAGFIGSNLIERLLKEEAHVRCVDNLATGKIENIQAFLSHPNFTFIEKDIRDAEACLKFCQGAEIVFHQAALGSVPRSVSDPLPTHETNSSGFINVLHAAQRMGVKRFVFASSSSVYGDHSALPKVEDQIGNQLSPYAVSKYSNELYAKVFSELYGMETIGLRYFNVFGKNQDPDGAYAAVIPKFVKAILLNQPIEIHGDGLQSRDFTYIDNVVNANICAASATNKEAMNTIYNIAYGNHCTLLELLHLIQAKLHEVDSSISPANVSHVDIRKGDIKHSYADIRKAKELLGYDPKFSVGDGLGKTILWYQSFFLRTIEETN